MIYNEFSALIGKTPLLRLNSFKQKNGLLGEIVAKLEYYNPAGSVKDRVAVAMIEAAEEKGLLHPGATIIEPTSGNTGIGLAAVAAAKGYTLILTMPETMSIERRKLLKAYGAQIVLTDGSKGMAGAIERAKEMTMMTENSFMPSQFENPANPQAHYATTGPEIWADTQGQVDFFVATVGTGGTISGTGKYLKEQNPNIQVIAVEPEESAVLSGNEPGAHGIQGIGAGFIPKTLDTSVYDEIITVTTQDAIHTAKELAKTQGIFVGISSGAAAFAAKVLAGRAENSGKTIVVLLPDTGERYLSTALGGD